MSPARRWASLLLNRACADDLASPPRGGTSYQRMDKEAARKEIEALRREIERRSGRNVAIGAVYQTVDRLLDKRHLRVAAGPEGRRDGRARRFFTLTPSGAAALRAAAELHARMWAGVRLGRGDRQ